METENRLSDGHGFIWRPPLPLSAVVKLSDIAESCYDGDIGVVHFVLAHNRNRLFTCFGEVIHHSLEAELLSLWDFGLVMLNLQDYVLRITVLNYPVDICWVYSAIQLKTFEVDKLFHPFGIQDFALHGLPFHEFREPTGAVTIVMKE